MTHYEQHDTRHLQHVSLFFTSTLLGSSLPLVPLELVHHRVYAQLTCMPPGGSHHPHTVPTDRWFGSPLARRAKYRVFSVVVCIDIYPPTHSTLLTFRTRSSGFAWLVTHTLPLARSSHSLVTKIKQYTCFMMTHLCEAHPHRDRSSKGTELSRRESADLGNRSVTFQPLRLTHHSCIMPC